MDGAIQLVTRLSSGKAASKTHSRCHRRPASTVSSAGSARRHASKPVMDRQRPSESLHQKLRLSMQSSRSCTLTGRSTKLSCPSLQSPPSLGVTQDLSPPSAQRGKYRPDTRSACPSRKSPSLPTKLKAISLSPRQQFSRSCPPGTGPSVSPARSRRDRPSTAHRRPRR